MATGSIYPTEHVGFSSILLTKTVTYSRCITLVTLHISKHLLIEISQWVLTPVSGDSVFTIRPASDTTVGFSGFLTDSLSNKEVYQAYYGFAEGRVGPSANWRFSKSSDGKHSRCGFTVFDTLALSLPTVSRSMARPTFWTVVLT